MNEYYEHKFILKSTGYEVSADYRQEGESIQEYRYRMENVILRAALTILFRRLPVLPK